MAGYKNELCRRQKVLVWTKLASSSLYIQDFHNLSGTFKASLKTQEIEQDPQIVLRIVKVFFEKWVNFASYCWLYVSARFTASVGRWVKQRAILYYMFLFIFFTDCMMQVNTVDLDYIPTVNLYKIPKVKFYKCLNM